MAASEWDTHSHDRVIIQLDLDYFYAQYEASVDPSLRGQPFAIQQKHIVVTCNYLARAAGVKKLQLLTDAKRCCPNLIVINGEDITRYRACSKRIFRHVRTLLGGEQSLVQRLGMDELWCDVTALVQAHIQVYDQAGPISRKVFHLNDTASFPYDAAKIAGHAIGSHQGTSADVRLLIASHLCAYLRASIFETFCLTSSGGISTSKLLAKLVGGENKPENQTVLFTNAHQTYLDEIEMKKIAGVGVTFLKVLYEKLAIKAESASEESVTVDEDDMKIVDKNKFELLQSYKMVHLTVHKVRTSTDRAQLATWFGQEKGDWLWNMMHCNDHTPVVASSLYPKSISVEDSFLHCRTLDDVRTRLLDLTTDLLSRMDVDLTEQGQWVRFPSNLRLSPRFRIEAPHHDGIGRPKKGSRTSRSVALPAEAYEMHRPAAGRALELVQGALLPLFKRMITGFQEWDLSLLNVAVADMKEHRTTAGISNFLKASRAQDASLPCPEGMDDSVWTTLHVSLQREVMHDLKRQREEDMERSDLLVDVEEKRPRLSTPVGSNEEPSWPSDVEEDESGIECDRCWSVVPRFAYPEHVCLESS